MTRSRRGHPVPLIAFAVCVALNLWLSSVGWYHNLIEGHEFRQTQTALTARNLQREGFSLAYPLPLFGPPWSAPMEFPLYQAAVAGVSSLTGCALEQTGRIVSLFFFYLSLPAFFLLQRYLAIPPERRWLLLALIVTTPVYLYYSRVFFIESTALCFAAWFLLAYCRAVETRAIGWLIGGVALGIVAALTKSTTFAIFVFPAAWFTLSHAWSSRSSGSRGAFGVLALGAGVIALPLLAGIAWVHFGDTVKAGNPLAAFLTSHELSTWNFGTLAERFTAEFWRNILTIATSFVLLSPQLLFLVAFAFIISPSQRWRFAGLVACYFVGPLLFAHLYAIHDYYHYATGIFLLAALAMAWGGLLDLPNAPALGKAIAILCSIGLQVFGFTQTYFKGQTRGDLPQPELGCVLGAITRPDDVLLIYGLEWNPLVPYAADRKAIMVTAQYYADRAAQETVISRVPPGQLAALVIMGDTRLDRTFCQDLVSRHGFAPRPVLTRDDTDVYLSRSRVADAVAKLKKYPLTYFKLNLPPDSQIAGFDVWRHEPPDLEGSPALAMFSPRPSRVLSPYGVVATTVDGRDVFGAHAPTEITIKVPKGARRLRAGYGMAPQTYQGPQRTDGVEFRVEWRSQAKSSILSDQYLNPAVNLTDRSAQHLDLPLPDDDGELILSTLPGPMNNNAFDWSYWSEVEVR